MIGPGSALHRLIYLTQIVMKAVVLIGETRITQM
jgi:hypothetical protein